MRIKQLRKEYGYTQEKIANYVDVTPKTYRSWEKGDYSKGGTTLHYPSISSEQLEKLSELYNVSTDYILGKSDYRHVDNEYISQKIGLSDDAIAALELIKSDVDNLDLFCNNELDTLNFILENIYKNQKNGIGFTESILYYIGLYLDSDRIEKEAATNIRYKYDDTHYDSLKTGDCINGRTVQKTEVKYNNTGIDVNTPDRLSVFNITNNQHYALKIPELFKANALNKIQEKLNKLSDERKMQYEKTNNF